MTTITPIRPQTTPPNTGIVPPWLRRHDTAPKVRRCNAD